MSNQSPKEALRRNDESRLSMSHLNSSAVKSPPVQDDEDEDWGDMNTKKSVAKDDDLERELAGSHEEEEEDDESVPKQLEEEEEGLDDESVLKQLEELQNNLPTMEKMLRKKLDQINAQREKLDEEEEGIRNKINFLLVLGGKKPLSAEEDEEEDRPRRGRRKKSEVTTDKPQPQTQPAETPTTGGRGGKGRKRFKNDKTWKEVICEAFLTMKHPQNGKPFTAFVQDITNKVVAPKEKGGLGYQSTAEQPNTTVRINIYKLVNEEKRLISNDDGSYTLRKSAVREMGQDPDALVSAMND